MTFQEQRLAGERSQGATTEGEAAMGAGQGIHVDHPEGMAGEGQAIHTALPEGTATTSHAGIQANRQKMVFRGLQLTIQ